MKPFKIGISKSRVSDDDYMLPLFLLDVGREEGRLASLFFGYG